MKELHMIEPLTEEELKEILKEEVKIMSESNEIESMIVAIMAEVEKKSSEVKPCIKFLYVAGMCYLYGYQMGLTIFNDVIKEQLESRVNGNQWRDETRV